MRGVVVGVSARLDEPKLVLARRGWSAVKKEKSFLLAKISTDIFYTRSEIKNEFFISLARLIIKFEPTPIVETSFHYGAGIFIRLAP